MCVETCEPAPGWGRPRCAQPQLCLQCSRQAVPRDLVRGQSLCVWNCALAHRTQLLSLHHLPSSPHREEPAASRECHLENSLLEERSSWSLPGPSFPALPRGTHQWPTLPFFPEARCHGCLTLGVSESESRREAWGWEAARLSQCEGGRCTDRGAESRIWGEAREKLVKAAQCP